MLIKGSSAKMYSLSKFSIVLLMALLSYGCASQNFMSSDGFEVYVPEKRYLNESCSNLRRMKKEFDSNPRWATRKHLGLEPFKYAIASEHEREMINKNGRYITYALATNCR